MYFNVFPSSFGITGYLAIKIYGENLCMRIIASRVVDSCSETSVFVSSSTDNYTINFVRILLYVALLLILYREYFNSVFIAVRFVLSFVFS